MARSFLFAILLGKCSHYADYRIFLIFGYFIEKVKQKHLPCVEFIYFHVAVKFRQCDFESGADIFDCSARGRVVIFVKPIVDSRLG